MKTLDFGTSRTVRILKAEIGDNESGDDTETVLKTRKVSRKPGETLPQISSQQQYDLLCKIRYGQSLTNEENEGVTRIRQEINRKINGYKQQDVNRKLFDPNTLVKQKDVIEKLVECTLSCVFCSKQVVLLYDKARDMAQWSLDRIDNDVGHSASNTNVCCLKCNLERRRQNYDAFHWTKNLTISKEMCADEKT